MVKLERELAVAPTRIHKDEQNVRFLALGLR